MILAHYNEDLAIVFRSPVPTSLDNPECRPNAKLAAKIVLVCAQIGSKNQPEPETGTIGAVFSRRPELAMEIFYQDPKPELE